MVGSAPQTIESESLRLLLQGGRWIWTIHIPAVTAAMIFLWQEPFRDALIVWYAFYCLVVFAQRWYCVTNIDRMGDPKLTRRIFWIFTTSSVVIGSLWGILGFVFFPTALNLQYLITVLTGGAALAAVATLHFSAVTLSATLVTALPWLGLRHILEGSSESTIVGLLVWLFLGLLIQLGIQLHASSTRAIKTQLEHAKLLRELHERTEALDVARQDAINANEAKSRFLAHASHDLRQPLHAAGLFLESLDNDNLGSNRNAQVVQKVRSSLAGLSKLFDTLLDVTLLDTGQIEINQQAVAISAVFEQLESEFSPIATNENVLLRFAHSDLVLRTDPFVIRRMLQNLLSNALRNSNGGSVLIGCRRRGSTVDIQVLDNGIGISKTDQKLVFDEFTRLAADRTGETKSGLGLGLAIVARLAQMLGVKVTVDSELGKGSAFAIVGLDVVSEYPPAAEVVTRPSSGSLKGKRIWIFDNDPQTLDATVSLLKKWGCQVERSATPTFPNAQAPDLVICDYEFAREASGLDIVKRCREQFGADLPAIIISGNSSSELLSATRENQIPMLAKPVLPIRLRATLLHVFGVEQSSGNADLSSTGP